MPRLIGLTGPAGSGKSTVAQILTIQQKINLVYAFAEPIKIGVNAMLGSLFNAARQSNDFDCQKVKSTVLLPTGRTVRHILQTLGTEWGRECIHPDLWLFLAQEEWRKLRAMHPHPTMIITDARFNNEAAWIRRNGELWHMVRPESERPSVGSNGEQHHVSEKPIAFRPDMGDRLLLNDGSMDDLISTVRSAWSGRSE